MKLRSLKKSLIDVRSIQTETTLRNLLQISDPKLFKKVLSARNLSHHSANIRLGDVFIALAGKTLHGARFIPTVINRAGAVIVTRAAVRKFCTHLAPSLRSKLIIVPSTQNIAADLSANFYNHPSRHLSVTAITGTNGKTSLTWILEQLSLALKLRTGIIGTISIHYKTALHAKQTSILTESINTTPHAIDLQHVLAVMHENAIDHVFLEASSHGLKEQRLAATDLKSAIFTNFSHDHLDYHSSVADYLRSKLMILELLQKSVHANKRFLISLRTLHALKLQSILAPYAYKDLQLGLLTSDTLAASTLNKNPHSLNKALYHHTKGAPATKPANYRRAPPFLPLINHSHHHLYSYSMRPLSKNKLSKAFFSKFSLNATALPRPPKNHPISTPPTQSFHKAITEFSKIFTQTTLTQPLKTSLDKTYANNNSSSHHMHSKKARLVYETQTNLIGAMNGENLGLALLELASISASRSPAPPLNLWKNLNRNFNKPCKTFAITGRMQTVIPQNPTVIIDYAHTPSALKEALLALKPYQTSDQPSHQPSMKSTQASSDPSVKPSARSTSTNKPIKNLYVVFGCGGDRDPSKRSQMGKIAYLLSDGVFLTSDNSRSEDPHAIIKDIEKGILPLLKKTSTPTLPQASYYKIIPNRRKAIYHVITTLEENAIILIAGKGHERYENLGGTPKPFNEVALIKKAYRSRQA
ncbi:UDP-N-acetylmuramoyl-L-alanyl-D-glutamate--2,6-diaminopimelate ligase [Spirochaetota bacterium]|nr:UDP-N-acetylmuramoyl-L-alanyl-D-glutamate--2,6-diaminopimelate ligase [Spirochaetota bacterium]